MKFKIGDVYRGKTGEIMKVLEFSDTECRFQMLNPETLEETEFELCGPLVENLADFINGWEFKKIDLKTFKPTGLVEP